MVWKAFGICGAGGIAATAQGDATIATVNDMRQALIGEDPRNVERIWESLYQPKIFGRKGLTTRAISAIDIALWDIVAKSFECPLYQVLGGFTDEVRAYIAGGYYAQGKGLAELQDEMLSYVEQGANAVKMKVGAVPLREDEVRVRAVRDAIGPEIDLLVDANNAYVQADAVRMARILEEYDAFWFEEPVSPDNMRGSAATARSSTVPVAAGENEYTRWGFRELLETGAVDILNPDAMVLGGITEYRKVAALAAAYEIPNRAPRPTGGSYPLAGRLPDAADPGVLQPQRGGPERGHVPRETGTHRARHGSAAPGSGPGHGGQLGRSARVPGDLTAPALRRRAGRCETLRRSRHLLVTLHAP